MNNDWVKSEAEIHLSYLAKCASEKGRIDYLAAVITYFEAKGAERMAQDMNESFKKIFKGFPHEHP